MATRRVLQRIANGDLKNTKVDYYGGVRSITSVHPLEIPFISSRDPFSKTRCLLFNVTGFCRPLRSQCMVCTINKEHHCSSIGDRVSFFRKMCNPEYLARFCREHPELLPGLVDNDGINMFVDVVLYNSNLLFSYVIVTKCMSSTGKRSEPVFGDNKMLVNPTFNLNSLTFEMTDFFHICVTALDLLTGMCILEIDQNKEIVTVRLKCNREEITTNPDIKDALIQGLITKLKVA